MDPSNPIKIAGLLSKHEAQSILDASALFVCEQRIHRLFDNGQERV